MIQRPRAFSQIQLFLQRAGKVFFRAADAFFQFVPGGQITGNGGGKGAAGSMGVGILNPWTFKPFFQKSSRSIPCLTEKIRGIAGKMAAFYQNRGAQRS